MRLFLLWKEKTKVKREPCKSRNICFCATIKVFDKIATFSQLRKQL